MATKIGDGWGLSISKCKTKAVLALKKENIVLDILVFAKLSVTETLVAIAFIFATKT